MMRFHKNLLFLIALGFLVSCKAKTSMKEKDTQTSSVEKQLAGPVSFHLFDPVDAKVESSQVTAQTVQFGVRVPTFNLNYENNTYVQILRCGASFRNFLKSQFDNAKGVSLSDGRKWVWTDALGNSDSCRIVTLMTNARVYADLAAPNGNFFYAINPCVSTEFSKSAKDECSYALTFTENFKFDSALSDTFLKATEKLAAAESKYDGLSLDIQGLAQKMQDLQESCLQELQSDQGKIDARAAWVNIGTVVGAVVLTGVLGRLGSRSLKAKEWKKQPSGSLKNLAAQNPYLAAGAVMTGASGIVLAIQKALQSQASLGPYCTQADALAKQLSAMHSNGLLDKAAKGVLDASDALSELSSKFQGYNTCILAKDPSTCAD